MRLYEPFFDTENPFVCNFAASVTGEAATALLRRYLANDVLTLDVGASSLAPVMSAMGFISDVGLVFKRAANDYLVFMHFAQSLAWLIQINRAFDATVSIINGQTALVFEGTEALAKDLITIPVGEATFVFSEKKTAFPASMTDEACAALCVQKHVLTTADFADMDRMAPEIGMDHLFDLKDASRVFIGRALTEQFFKAMFPATIVDCVATNPFDGIPETVHSTVVEYRVTLFAAQGDKLFMRIIATDPLPEELTLTDGQTEVSVPFEVI